MMTMRDEAATQALSANQDCEASLGARSGPRRSWVVIADWCNLGAGCFLSCGFLLGALINSLKISSLLASPGVPTDHALKCLQFFLSAEGALYAVASFFMVGVMAETPPQLGGGPRGAMQFAILLAGGIFFALSGLVFPPCVNNISYVLSKQACTHPAAAGTPYVWNAMSHFGITCFMWGTAIGFKGILAAPKQKLLSPFWGVTMYFLGAWTIGIFKIWGPTLCGGVDSSSNYPIFDFDAPAVTWTFTWWFALLGAIFLTLGAWILGFLNGSFGNRRA